MNKYSEIYRLTVDPASGASLNNVCRQAYTLQEELGIPVEVVYNGMRYVVALDVKFKTTDAEEAR